MATSDLSSYQPTPQHTWPFINLRHFRTPETMTHVSSGSPLSGRTTSCPKLVSPWKKLSSSSSSSSFSSSKMEHSKKTKNCHFPFSNSELQTDAALNLLLQSIAPVFPACLKDVKGIAHAGYQALGNKNRHNSVALSTNNFTTNLFNMCYIPWL